MSGPRRLSGASGYLGPVRPPEVLRIENVPQPALGPDEVLIQVRATTVNRTDTEVRAGQPAAARIASGFPRPRRAWRILGTEVAGVVAAKGPRVSEFAVGDEVFGVNAYRFGTHAEFVCMRESAALAHKPSGASFDEAAAVCDGAILVGTGQKIGNVVLTVAS